MFSESIGETDPSKECGPDWVNPGSRRFKVASWRTDSVTLSQVPSQIVLGTLLAILNEGFVIPILQTADV